MIQVAVMGDAATKIPRTVPPHVKLDDSGTLLQVRAGDPRSALLGYCQNAAGSLCEPVELAWGQPRHADVRRLEPGTRQDRTRPH